MRDLRPTAPVLAVLLSLSLIAAACTSNSSGPGRSRTPEEVDEGLIEEQEEQAEKTEKRLEALEEAIAAGTLGVIEPIVHDAAPGWAGEEILNDTGDDWEPAIATDPNRPFVYVAHNRFGGAPACANCPDPAMILHVSKDGGKTWRPESYLCPCEGVTGQHDPLLEVVPENGDVIAAWMNSFKIHFSRSTDHGKSWSEPVHIHPDVQWGDKPNMAVSADGQDVYILFNGPSVGDVHAASSHDGGATWSTVRITNGDRYFYDYGGAVLPGGRVVFSHISITYSGPGNEAEGVVQIHVFASDDAGDIWSNLVVDELELGTECTSRDCYADYYDAGPALAADENGDLVIVYSGAAEPKGPRTVYARSSTDGGLTWGARTRLSRQGVNAAFAAAVGTGDEEVRVWFADQRTGRWNVRYLATTDLGATWSKSVKISDAISGTAYKNKNGFIEIYGDYGEIAITSEGKTVTIWGEGPSYFGPGGIWFNRER